MKDLLTLARDAFDSSTTYLDANYRQQWENNIALFDSRHPTDSKYNQDSYKHRSRLFRPKTRSVVRKNEAAAAAAFFANVDVVSIEAEDDSDKSQQASAELMVQLVNYRLQKTIPWYKIVIGALQDAQVYGIVSTYIYWKYQEKVTEQEMPITDDMGNVLGMQSGQSVKVVKDEPCVEPLPPENLRFDSGADWLDVVGTSPYIIRMVPMYVGDVKQMMQRVDRKTGQPQWRQLTDGEIRQAKTDYDSLRQAREKPRQDPKAENETPISDFEIVWCHENFVRLDGEEIVYWTMGTQHLLSDPKSLDDVYYGERPFVIGTCAIESHRAVPSAYVKLSEQLQREANDVANQRMDNVRLVLNKRWIAKRGKNVDVQSLLKNVPGAVTLADNIEDVQEINWPDVTSSAYAEQDRINVDFDELVGNFSSGSVQTNRQLNETVGGMQLMQGGASLLTEYLLRTFVETWAEPVLRKLVKLEQRYETDLTILGLAGQKAQLVQKYGIDQITDELLSHELTTRVNVGMGATDPNTKLQKFAMAAQTYANVAQSLPDADTEQVRKEIFGLAGYRDGARFFKKQDDDPEAQQQAAEAAEVQKRMVMAELQAKELANAKLAKEIETPDGTAIKAEESQATLALKQQEAEFSATLERDKAIFKQRLDEMQVAASIQLDRDKAEADAQIAREKAVTDMNIAREKADQDMRLREKESAQKAEQRAKQVTVQRGQDGKVVGATLT